MEVRKAKLEDFDAVSGLSDEINEQHYSYMPNDFIQPNEAGRDKEFWIEFWKSDGSIFLVAEVAGKVVGFITGSISRGNRVPFVVQKTKCHIGTIVVSNVARRQGIGKMLYTTLVEQAKAKGAKETLILTDNSALIVSVKNDTIVTVMDRNSLKDNVFTKIDSTVVL